MSIMAHERSTTTDPTAVATAHSVGLLDEYTRTLDALPMDLSRHFADLRELDAVLSASVQQLILKVEALVAVLQAGNVRKEDRLWMLTEIAEEAARLKLGGEDKIRVVCTAADGLRVHNDHMASLLTQMPSFDRAELIRRTVYPHVTNRIFPPASYNEGGRRRRGALLTASNGAEPSSSNNKRKRNPKEDEDPAGGRTPRKERVGGEAAPPRNKNPNRTRKTERAPSPTESVVSVTSHIQNYTATQVQPSRSGGNRAGSSNKKRAAGGGSRPEPSPLGVPPAAHHPSLPAPPFMPSPGGAWPLEGPGVPRPVPLAGPGMPVPSQQPPQQSQPQAAAGEPMDEFDDPDRADDEKIYCFCNRPSFGSMIACDADDCEREWFHIECVGVTGEPEGKWYCDECRAKQAKKPPPRNRNAKSRKSGGARNGRATGAGQS